LENIKKGGGWERGGKKKDVRTKGPRSSRRTAEWQERERKKIHDGNSIRTLNQLVGKQLRTP